MWSYPCPGRAQHSVGFIDASSQMEISQDSSGPSLSRAELPRRCAMRPPSHWRAPLPLTRTISISTERAERREVLGIFTGSWKSSPFEGIPTPIENTQEKTQLLKYWLRFLFSSFNYFAYLITWRQLPFRSREAIQMRVSGAHPGLRPPSGIFVSRQGNSKSSRADSVYKSGVSDFPLRAHTPEMTKWGKRPAFFPQH